MYPRPHARSAVARQFLESLKSCCADFVGMHMRSASLKTPCIFECKSLCMLLRMSFHKMNSRCPSLQHSTMHAWACHAILTCPQNIVSCKLRPPTVNDSHGVGEIRACFSWLGKNLGENFKAVVSLLCTLACEAPKTLRSPNLEVEQRGRETNELRPNSQITDM